MRRLRNAASGRSRMVSLSMFSLPGSSTEIALEKCREALEHSFGCLPVGRVPGARNDAEQRARHKSRRPLPMRARQEPVALAPDDEQPVRKRAQLVVTQDLELTAQIAELRE